MSGRHPWSELQAEIDRDPASRAEVDEIKRAMYDVLALQELRESRKVTQTALAETLDMTQANISRIERQDDLYLSTIEEYIEGLGGRLEVRAVFPDHVVSLEVRRKKGRARRRSRPE